MRIYEAHGRRLARRFIRLVGRDAVDRRAEAIIQRCEDNPILAEYLRDQYALEVGLYALAALLEEDGAIDAAEMLAVHRAFHFSTAFMLTRRQLHVSQRHMLDRRFSGLLSDEQGLAPMEHELSSAFHLISDGFKVEPAEARGLRCDWVARKAGIEFELECKHISKEKGRRIRSLSFLPLASFIDQIVAPHGVGPEICNNIEFTCDSELPRDPADLQRIANEWHLRFIAGRPDGRVGDVSWNTNRIEIPAPQATTPLERRAWLKSHYEKEMASLNTFSVIIADDERSMLISAKSKRPETLIAGTEKELLESCKHQFTAQRPGILYVRFAGLSQNGLEEILRIDQTGATALKRMANRILDRRPHIHTVSFPTIASLEPHAWNDTPHTQTVSQLTGKAYSFRNGKCCFPEALSISLFNGSNQSEAPDLP